MVLAHQLQIRGRIEGMGGGPHEIISYTKQECMQMGAVDVNGWLW